MPAVGRVQASSASIFAGAGALVDDSSSASQNFIDVLGKAAGSAAQKSDDAPAAESKSPAPAAQASKLEKKGKPTKAHKDDAPADQVNSKPSTKTQDDPAATASDETATSQSDTQTDQTTTVADAGASDSTPDQAEAQLAAYAGTAQALASDAAIKPTQSKAAPPARIAQKVQQSPTLKIQPNVQPIDDDNSTTPDATAHDLQTRDAHQKAPVAQPLLEDSSKNDATPTTPATDSAQDAVRQSAPQVSPDQANASKPQVAPKPPVRQAPAFGRTILRDAQVTGSSDAASKAGTDGKTPDAPPTQTSQPIDADALISVSESKGRAKLTGDDQSDGKDSAFDAAPPAPPKVAHTTLPLTDKPVEARFAEVNHPEIVNNIRGQLLPNGGSMQLRLDPPDLGRLDVTVTMKDGVMSAAFATANDQATRLLSHSLGQLKTALESAGVTVEKLQVQQSPKSQGGDTSDAQQQPREQQDPSARQEQQRKEILERMWERISMGPDDVDVTG